MSIPKEPRQLMINLMYLVLTAMLALNVSAEIINAFFKIHNSNVATNKLLDEANNKVLEGMKATVETKEVYAPLVTVAEEARGIVRDFNTYVDDLLTRLGEEAGGLYPPDYEDKSKAGKPRRYKDKEVPQRMFVEGSPAVGDKPAMEPVGPQLKAKILETRDKLVELVKKVQGMNIEGTKITDEDIQNLMTQLALNVDETAWQESGKPSWEAYTFGYMPVAAVYPLLSKYQSDAKTSESSIVNFLSSQMGVTTIEFDKFQAVASAEKGYIIRGETYKAEVFLSASSSQADVSVSVNGARLPVKDGVAVYTATPSSYGEQKYSVSISVRNPLSGKVDTYKKDFSYEVGERSVAVSADKMNVFYIGVDNPLSVAAAGVSSNSLRVSGEGCNVAPGSGKGKYVVTASNPTDNASITVSGEGLNSKFPFRVKRIPDPLAVLRPGGEPEGTVGNGEFSAMQGVIPELRGFDFDAKCTIVGFELTRQAARQDPVTAPNQGGRYEGRAANLVAQAKPGDVYYFQNIRAQCPGDKASRKLNGMVWKIR